MLDPSKRTDLYTLQRATLAWLAQHEAPSGTAINVPIRRARTKVDLAAMWCPQPSTAVSKRRNAMPLPVMRSAIFLCHGRREDCWPECAQRQDIAKERAKVQELLEQRQTIIRRREPHLREDNVLFAEFASWDYQSSKDEQYHLLCERVAALDRMLYQGSRIERLAEAQAANQLYLVVPQRHVMPQELHDAWGLLWMNKRGILELIKAAPERPIGPGSDYLFIHYMLNGGTRLVNELFDLYDSKPKNYALSLLKKHAASRRRPRSSPSATADQPKDKTS
jgi:hypothetical protein